MKKILSGLVLSAFLAAPAVAADMPVKARPMPVATVFSWTGCYVGGHVGYAWGKKDVDPLVPVANFTYDHDINGVVAGGQVGCNLWQSDRWVFGIEGQASWADLDGQHYVNTTAVTNNGFRTEADIIGSIAARLGYAFGATGQTLVFVKGGAAFIHEQFLANGTANPASWLFSSGKDLRWGWMVGAGIEQALTSNWSLKGEYNYSNFGSDDYRVCNAAQTQCFDYGVKQHVHLVKFGINYRFGGGPIVASY